MSALEPHNYENPDDLPEDDDFEVIVEDDTPEEDRGREPMPEDIVEDLENDDLSKYEGEVKNRMSQMKKVWHDERRAKEAAERERFEAIHATKNLIEENRRLKKTLTEGEREYIQTVQVASQLALEAAKRNLMAAHETGDPERLIEAQQTFNEATIKHERAANFKPALQPDENSVEQHSYKPNLDPKTQEWMSRNKWFGRQEDMSRLAMAHHQVLVAKHGEAYAGSDDYFRNIDKQMRQDFPDYFGSSRSEAPAGTQTLRKPATVVASATRSTTPKQIKLTQTQMKIIQKTGLTPEQYVKEVLKLEGR